MGGKLEKATLAGGCFWCTEAVFLRVKGVKSVESGYSGGTMPNPRWEEVCAGTTGHAEAIQVTFDPRQAAFRDLLEIFWQAHDPTSLNRQGYDVGPEYRSAIFFHNPAQKKAAEESKAAQERKLGKPVVTEITPFTNFYRAEEYHQDYFNRNPSQPYCRLIIAPKLARLKMK